MVSPATDFWEICRSKPYWVTLATPTVNHGGKIIFVSCQIFVYICLHIKVKAIEKEEH